MIKFRDSEITQILPEALADLPETQALSYALKKANQRFVDYCANISVYALLDTAPEDVLDLLAVELDTQYYDTSLPIENKRELVKGTLVWFQTAGTPSAVEELVAAVFGSGTVSEWYEYGDDPYFFKIATNVDVVTPDIVERFMKIITRVKNARSHLRKVDIVRNLEGTMYFGGTVVCSKHMTLT